MVKKTALIIGGSSSLAQSILPLLNTLNVSTSVTYRKYLDTSSSGRESFVLDISKIHVIEDFLDKINGKEFELTPPNIGIQKSFTDYIIRENNESKTPNLAFLKIIPFMLEGRSSITYEGIKAKLSDFEQMDDVSFQFLNAAVGKMTFGIKELAKEIDGQEVRAEMQFPNGASGVFVVHDAFEAFIKE